jgi:hypothetical protein
MTAFAAFTDFKTRILQRHGLTTPDGRHLYAYRLEDNDFEALETLLRHHLSLIVDSFGLEAVCNRLTGFPELFVLYAAEWWRRRFGANTHVDSRWAWEPILHDMGAGTVGWDANHRSECVHRGLKAWRLGVQDGGGFRYLGTIALQGGLPLSLLAEARGGIGAILGRVLQLADRSEVTPADLHAWVESLQHKLPQSYRQVSVFKLLAEMVWTTISLKEQAKLSAAHDAIEKLDAGVPGWRDRYPIALGDGHAQALIEQLIRDAAGLRARPALACLTVERRLVGNVDDGWHLESSLSLPETVQTRQVSDLFSVAGTDLPGQLTLTLDVGDVLLGETRLRRMAGRDGFRVDRQPWSAEGSDAARDHLLCLGSADGRQWRTTAPRGGEMEEDLPWVFGAEADSHLLLHQGGGAVAPLEALIAWPVNWDIEAGAGALVERVGTLGASERALFRIRGVVTCIDPMGRRCRLRTGQAGIQETVFEFRGDRPWFSFRSPSNAYRGVPSLYQVAGDGVPTRAPSGRLEWSPIGGVPGIGSPPWGPVVCRYSDKGDLRFQSRLVLLPPTASLSLTFGDTNSGTIQYSVECRTVP